MTTISTTMMTTTPIAGRAGLVDGMGVEWQCVVAAPCTWTWCLFWQCQRSSEQRSHESVQFMISRRSFWLSPALFISVCDLRLRLVACRFAFACALSGHSAGQTTHADYTGLHYRYSGVMRALPAWPPKWRASSRQPGGVGQSHVVAIGGGGKETRDARIKSKRSSCLYFLCAR